MIAWSRPRRMTRQTIRPIKHLTHAAVMISKCVRVWPGAIDIPDIDVSTPSASFAFQKALACVGIIQRFHSTGMPPARMLAHTARANGPRRKGDPSVKGYAQHPPIRGRPVISRVGGRMRPCAGKLGGYAHIPSVDVFSIPSSSVGAVNCPP